MELFFAVCREGKDEHHVHLPNEKIRGLKTHEGLVLRAKRILRRDVIRVMRCDVDEELLVDILMRFMDVAVAARGAFQRKKPRPRRKK